MKITSPQRKALENMAAGRKPDHGLRHYGGHTTVMYALVRRDWAEWVPDKGYRITKEGREALKP